MFPQKKGTFRILLLMVLIRNMLEIVLMRCYAMGSPIPPMTNNWSMRAETQTYQETDLISLFEVLTKFEIFFNSYQLEIIEGMTWSSQYFKIFRKHFQRDTHRIPIIKGESARSADLKVIMVVWLRFIVLMGKMFGLMI